MLVIPKKKRRARSPTQAGHLTLEHLEEHLNNPFRSNHLFRTLSPTLKEQLRSLSSPATYRKDHVLFAEGQLARGVFLIEQGRVKLEAESSDGKSLILHIAMPGEIAGLPATVSGRRYEVTAETMETSLIRFVTRRSFLHWAEFSGGAGLKIAEVVSDIYFATYSELRYLGLSTAAEARLARFLLAKTFNHKSHGSHHESTRIHMTHQQIASIIGLSRETVTRLLAEFKRKGLVTPQNSHLIIESAEGLRNLLI